MTACKTSLFVAALLASSALAVPQQARAADQAETIAALQRQIDELRAQVMELRAARQAVAGGTPTQPPATTPAGTAATTAAAAPAAAPVAVAVATPKPAARKGWYEKLQIRGYTQIRMNEQFGGARTAPAGVSRLRSVQDSSLGEPGNFSIRRARLVLQGDLSDRVSIYIQGDLASVVNNQSNGERRDHFFQMRDAYADIHFLGHRAKLRVGQSKVPFGWENLQSSSNRIAIDRADGANSAVPGERDLGAVLYFTPPSVQAIWDELNHDGQKLFGNYGAFGLGVFNGQGTNRPEKNDGLMKVAMATWPFRLDPLGAAFKGQVLELGVQGMLNRVQPELRSGGVTPVSIDEKRVNLHAILYPNPFGVQAEWSWGRSPVWNPAKAAIESGPTNGGYVQIMYRIKKSFAGTLMPYARWQRFDGGWKTATNAPRIRTNEVEAGIEWLPIKEIELTLAYVDTRRSEADERRQGQAHGQLIRSQIQINY